MSELDTLFVILYSIFDNIFFIIALAAILKNAIFKNVPVIFQRFIGAKFHLHWSYLPNPLLSVARKWINDVAIFFCRPLVTLTQCQS